MDDIRGVDSRLVISQSNGLLINRPNKNCIGWIGNKSNKRIDPNKGSLFPENKQTYMYAYLECESIWVAHNANKLHPLQKQSSDFCYELTQEQQNTYC